MTALARAAEGKFDSCSCTVAIHKDLSRTQARTGRSGLVDQLYNPTAICGIGHFSSSPQIAWTFFRSASNAAVSAKAASLRRSSRSSSRMRLRSALVVSDCRAATWSVRSLACSQLARQRRICSAYKPRRRQYSASSSSVRAAVSSTALNFCCELQPSVVADALGNKRPALRACLRQLYIVAVEMPSSAARSLTVRLYGASSLARMASRRSGEYFMGTVSLPLVEYSNSNIGRGSNYSDSGGAGEHHGKTPRKQPLLNNKLGVTGIGHCPNTQCSCGVRGLFRDDFLLGHYIRGIRALLFAAVRPIL